MAGTQSKMSVENAAARLDRAMEALETSVANLAGRMRTLSRAEDEAQRLSTDRARLASELDRTSARAERLDEVAGDVSRRLVDAMENVRSVLEQ